MKRSTRIVAVLFTSAALLIGASGAADAAKTEVSTGSGIFKAASPGIFKASKGIF